MLNLVLHLLGLRSHMLSALRSAHGAQGTAVMRKCACSVQIVPTSLQACQPRRVGIKLSICCYRT